MKFLSAGVSAVLLTALSGDPGLATTVDFSFDDEELLRMGESRGGRAVVLGKGGLSADEPVPVVVFLHGLNDAGPVHKWLGGEGIDLRLVTSSVAEAQGLRTFVLAAPSQTRNAARGKAMWNGFDLARFVDAAEAAYGGQLKIDRQRVILVGHSGAGCNPDGGLLAAADGTLLPTALIAVDTCLDEEAWTGLGLLPSHVQIRVYAQTKVWPRNVASFREQLAAIRTYGGVQVDDLVEEVDEPGNAPHETLVATALRRALPPLLKPERPGAKGAPGTTPGLREMLRAAVRPVGWVAPH